VPQKKFDFLLSSLIKEIPFAFFVKKTTKIFSNFVLRQEGILKVWV